jgi:hypothetical protein
MSFSRLPPSELDCAHPEDRRRHGRAYSIGVRCELGDIIDVSASGMRVLGFRRPRLSANTTRVISIDTPAGVMEVEVRLAWVRRLGWMQVEFGLEFVHPTPETISGLLSILHACAIGPIEAEFIAHRKSA